MDELILRITAQTKGIPAMVQALATIMFQAKLEAGCVGCHLYTENGNPRALRYVEQWATRKDLDVQIRSPRFSALLAIMETAPEAPDLEIRNGSEQHGLEYVRALRLKGENGAGKKVT